MCTLRDSHSSPVVCPHQNFCFWHYRNAHTDEVRGRRGRSPEPECVQQEETWAAGPGTPGRLSLGGWHLRCCEGREEATFRPSRCS